MQVPSGRAHGDATQLARFENAQEYPLIGRRNRVPTLTVRADVNPGVLPDTVVAALQPGIDALNAQLERPYRVELGGIAEESAYSQASVVAVVPMMLLIMLTLLMFQLGSFRRLFLVLALLPSASRRGARCWPSTGRWASWPSSASCTCSA